MGKYTVDDLKSHLDKYKDALVIIGPNATRQKNFLDVEGVSELLTNKALRRNPEGFWKFFKEHVYVDSDLELTKAQNALIVMQSKGLIKDVVNQSNDPGLNGKIQNLINLHGTTDTYKCPCKLTYTDNYVMSYNTPPICEVCGKPLRPNILLTGETYYGDQYHVLKHLLLETHTLFLIGFDYEEDALTNLVADYSKMKETLNVQGEEQRMLVTVGTSEYLNVNEVGRFEFIVSDDCNAAMSRLIELL